ncbi:MAG: hypothetical protein R6U21_00835 [Thermoplasmatota archaeon]
MLLILGSMLFISMSILSISYDIASSISILFMVMLGLAIGIHIIGWGFAYLFEQTEKT